MGLTKSDPSDMITKVKEMETTTTCMKGGEKVADVQYLEDVIKGSGLKISYLAEKCGLTRQGFRLKCKRPESFTAAQVATLCKELRITQASTQRRIFFT